MATKAKVLKLSEAAEWNRKVIWMEMLETAGAIPVTFYAEHIPFLRFDCEDRVMMIEVRGEYYGKTWRCWNEKPDGQAADWQDPEGGAEPEVEPAKASDPEGVAEAETEPAAKPAKTAAKTGAGKPGKAKMEAQIAADVRKATGRKAK